MNKDEILKDVMPQVRVAARQVANNWPGVVEEDDVTQEIYLRLLEAGDSQISALEDQAKIGLIKLFTRIGQQAASKEADDYLAFSGNCRYSVENVRALLDNGALFGAENGEQYTGTSFENVPISTAAVFDKGTVADVVDLRIAFAHLNQNMKDALGDRYISKGMFETSGERKDVSRATTALTREMNRSFQRRSTEHEGPGSR